jgi:hypothetical protein
MTELNPAIFQKRIGEIALELGLISPDVQNRMVEVQARAIALIMHGKPAAPVADLADDAKWAALAAQAGVQQEKLDAARNIANSPQVVNVPGVPPAGAILSGIPGGVAPEVKDALLAAQASERALQVLDNIGKPGAAYDDKTLNDFFQQLEQEMPHLGRTGEAAIVQKAQQTYKNALQFNAMEHHVDCHSLPQQAPEVQQERAFLKATLPQIASTTYRTAAITLGVHSAQLAKDNAPQAEAVAAAADAMVNMLVNKRGVAPVTPEELQSFASEHMSNHRNNELENTARTASNLNEGAGKWVGIVGGNKGQNPATPGL